MKTEVKALWQRELRPIQHRILWLLIDLGVPGKELQHGWQDKASKLLDIHRITLRRQVQCLVAEGILVEGKLKGSVRVELKIFVPAADKSVFRMKKVIGAKRGG